MQNIPDLSLGEFGTGILAGLQTVRKGEDLIVTLKLEWSLGPGESDRLPEMFYFAREELDAALSGGEPLKLERKRVVDGDLTLLKPFSVVQPLVERAIAKTKTTTLKCDEDGSYLEWVVTAKIPREGSGDLLEVALGEEVVVRFSPPVQEGLPFDVKVSVGRTPAES